MTIAKHFSALASAAKCLVISFLFASSHSNDSLLIQSIRGHCKVGSVLTYNVPLISLLHHHLKLLLNLLPGQKVFVDPSLWSLQCKLNHVEQFDSLQTNLCNGNEFRLNKAIERHLLKTPAN